MNLKTRKLLKTLKKRRLEEGFSLRSLSKIIGISFSTLARLEKGSNETEPDPNTKARIINWLGEECIQEIGISFEESALVHFRASKDASPKTIEYLLELANLVKKQYGND